MAKSNQSKKSTSAKGGENKDRNNGKAWKKDKFKPKRVRTPERQEKNFVIRMAREKRRQEGMARHAAEMAAIEEARKAEAQERAAKAAAEEVARQLIIESRKKPFVPTLKPALV